MTLAIAELTEATEQAYSQFLLEVPTSLLYHSLDYRNFLRGVLGDARARYLLALQEGRLVAALPTFVKQGRFGPVVNSLPFYGSNGSIVALPGTGAEVKRELLRAFEDLCGQERAIASTIISNPLDHDDRLFEEYRATILDHRIGQFTPLPDEAEPENLEDRLMNSFHVKTRNSVRKGAKSGFEFGHDGSEQTLSRLSVLHEQNLRSIGGLAKPWAVFQSIRKYFEYDKDYRIFIAQKAGDVVSALLVFFFNRVAEYFVPATQEEFRSDQPMSYLILLAMKEAVRRRCSFWNWGGTWLTQSGVQSFKARWGTKDIPYRYFVKEYGTGNSLRNESSAALLEAYPYFYTVPFSCLKGGR